MEPAMMLQVSTYLFGLTALGGVAMGLIRFSSGKNPPSWLAMMHGFLAAAGLTLLAYAVLVLDAPSLAFMALLLFVVGSAGGIALNLVYHLKGIPLPKWIVVVHALISVLALVLLYMAAFGGD